MASYNPPYSVFRQTAERFVARGYAREKAKGAYWLWRISPTFPFYMRGGPPVYIDATHADLAKLLTRVEGIEASHLGTRPNDKFTEFKHKTVRPHDGRVVFESWKFELTTVQACDAFMEICEAFDRGGIGEAQAAAAAIPAKAEKKTQRAQVTNARVGQGAFKKALVRLWKTCSVTGCSIQQILKASHIKPWADSSPEEKLDHFNGLLLTPNLDALFDAGLISFDEDGRIMLSPSLTEEDFRALGVTADMKLRKLNTAHAPYLKHHREEVFEA